MIRFKFGSANKLRQEREDTQRALQLLGGTIATVQFNGADPASVEAAIRQMESAVDGKIAAYRGNGWVAEAAKAMKDSYRKAILKRASEDRNNGNSVPEQLVLRGKATLETEKI